MKTRNAKVLLAMCMSFSMALTGFGSSITNGIKTAAAEDEESPALVAVLGADDITLRVDWNDTSNVGAERTVNIKGGTSDSMVVKDNGTMRKDLTSQDLADKEMGLGINLGNTMEASLDNYDRADPTTWPNVTTLETAWGAAVTTQEYIDCVHSYGINTLRVPVAWSNLVADGDDTYTIDETYLGRVEEIVNYALNLGMYVVINDHWDNQWWGQFGACKYDENEKKVANMEMRAAAWNRYESYWTQISERFQDYSDHLIFEGANEELGERLNDAIGSNGFAVPAKSTEKAISGNLTTDQLYETTNAINQKFVEIVRKTSSDDHPNNRYRHLLIPGYNTDISCTADTRFIMPTDTIAENGNSKLFLSVHYYTPWDFCGDGGTGTYTAADQKATKDYFKMLSKFKDAGYGIIIGECGICNPAGVESSVTQWFHDTFTEAQKYSAVPVLWDTGAYFDRAKPAMVFNDIAVFYNTVNGTNGDTSMTRISGGVPSKVDNERPIGAYIDKELWGKTGIHAYLFYQTASYDYRDIYAPFRKLGANAKSYEYIKASAQELSADAKVTDVYIDHDGEYTVSIDKLDLSGSNFFRMLGISTDLDYQIYKDSNVTMSNVTIKFDGKAINEDPVSLVPKTDAKYYAFMAVNQYDAKAAAPLQTLNDNDNLSLPSKSMEITFTISGLSKALADIENGSYIDPVTGKALNDGVTAPPTETPVETTAPPVVTPTPVPTEAPTETPTAPTVIGSKVNTTFTSGSYKYKITKVATTASNGTATLVGLTSKGSSAKSVSVAATVKKGDAVYKVSSIGAKAFKSAKATSITLNKNIKVIPASSFANCKKLSKLTINAKLTKVAKNSFKGCKKKIKVKGTSAKANIKLLKKSGYKKFN